MSEPHCIMTELHGYYLTQKLGFNCFGPKKSHHGARPNNAPNHFLLSGKADGTNCMIKYDSVELNKKIFDI